MGEGSVARFLRGTCLVAFLLAAMPVSPAVAAEGSTVSDFSLPSLSGEQVRLSDYRGKVVIISFWATWCKPCAQELDFLQELYASQQGDDLVILAISTDGPETFAEVRNFVKQKGWTMPVLLDPEGSVASVLNPRFANPFSVYIDRAGRKVTEHEGFTTGDIPKLRMEIEGLLERRAQGQAVSDFSLPNLAGEQVRLSELKGQVVVISFWATWCQPCAQELDFLQELYAKHEGEGLVVLALNTDGPETFAEVRNFVKRKGWTMPVLLDPEGTVASVLNPRFATPFSMYIDRNGRKISEHEGFTTGDIPGITAHINTLLADAVDQSAGGGPATSMSFTNRFVTELHGDNQNGTAGTFDDHYGLIFNQLNGLITQGDLTFQFRTNSWVFTSPPNQPGKPDDYVDSENFSDNLERITWQYRVKGMTLTGGDFYQQLGRGITLSIRKADETGLDRAIRGARYRYTGDRFQITGFAGTVNARNMDAISQKYVMDPHDVLAGSSLEFRPINRTKVGLFALSHTVTERSTVHELLSIDENDHTESFGGFLELTGLLNDRFSIYVEGDVQNRTKLGEEEEFAGKAGYLVADLNLGRYTVMFEGLYLDAFEQKGSTNTALTSSFEYNQPPTLERIDQEVFNNRDVAGGRLRLQGTFLDRKLVVFANGMFRVMEPSGVQPVRQLHGYAGVEYLYDEGRSRLGFSAGYRSERNLEELDGIGGAFSQSGNAFKTIKHVDLDYLQDLRGRLSVHLVSNLELRGLTSPTADGLSTHNYIRGSTFLGLEVSQFGGITFEFGYDTLKDGEGVANFFFAGILAAEINHSSFLRLTAGTQRGGLKCIAGICRDYPGFSGLRAEWVSRF